MFLVGLLSWWYGDGLVNQYTLLERRTKRTASFFSISTLLKTLFYPYKQISAGIDDSSFVSTMRSLGDQLISRIIGSFVRTSTVVIGMIVLVMQFVLSVLGALLWIATPVIPIFSAIMFAIGWVPGW